MDAAAEIGQMEKELFEQEILHRQAEEKLSSAKSNRTAGAGALLIGLIGGLFFPVVWYLWVFLIIIGALTLITAISKQKDANSSIQEIDSEIIRIRQTLAEKNAFSRTQALSSSEPDYSSRLKQIKSMLDDGLITQEEFDEKRTQLLASI